MAKSQDPFVVECVAAFQHFGTSSARPMFGAYGAYLDGRFVAIIEDGVLYGKADSESIPRWIELGSTIFSYESNGERVEMKYYSVPGDSIFLPGEFRPYVDLMVGAAERAALRKKKPAAAKKPK